MKKIAFLLLTILPALSLADEKIADWNLIDTDTGVHFANTSSSDGSVAGVACVLNQGCQAYIITQSSRNCEEGASYPMMINSPIGAALVNTRCITVGNIRVLAIQEATAIDAFESGGDIGFAIPLKSGYFTSERFSTKGATAAIQRAMKFPAKASPGPASQTTF